MKKKALLTAGAGLLALMATDAQAYRCRTITSSTLLTPQSVTVPRSLSVGSPIGSVLLSGSVSTFECSDSPAPALTYQEFGVKGYGTYVATINGRRVYSTNVAGVGYSVGATTTNICAGVTEFVDGENTGDGNENNKLICAINGLWPGITAQARIQFYKTAQSTGSGTVSGRQVGSFVLRNLFNSWVYPESAIRIADFNVTSTGCTVSNTAISVPMGTVEKRAFGGPGTWPGDAKTRSFSIPLDCDVGTRVIVKIDGSAQNAVLGVLNLNEGNSSASGVGIQLLYQNAPLMLATPIYAGTTTSDGTYSIPLQARYYQTGSNITPGAANASATFTMTYQ
ncbi:fimbrial protein [Pantoea stewartii]|uniref:fimbrial protein n=1 Tax=Pantoea stewartii TaxID=66269 RepID=UPI0023F755C6|nr:fimbrial protein [Pantoea stewartii]MDF7788620.1 fimbrial protein [Pantoea stewartii]